MITGKAENLQGPKGGPAAELFVSYSSVTRTQLEQFEFLLDKSSSETELEKFLRDNPGVLVNSLRVLKTGYDGAWVIPRQLIRSSLGAARDAPIPDFIVGGCNSCCCSWFVLKFKGADQQILSESDKDLCFSSTVNRAIGQVVESVDYCASAQSFLREALELLTYDAILGYVRSEIEFQENRL